MKTFSLSVLGIGMVASLLPLTAPRALEAVALPDSGPGSTSNADLMLLRTEVTTNHQILVNMQRCAAMIPPRLWNGSTCVAANGADGANGANGASGANGTNGTNGADGQSLGEPLFVKTIAYLREAGDTPEAYNKRMVKTIDRLWEGSEQLRNAYKSICLVDGIGNLPAQTLATPAWVENCGRVACLDAINVLPELAQLNGTCQDNKVECGGASRTGFALTWQCMHTGKRYFK